MCSQNESGEINSVAVQQQNQLTQHWPQPHTVGGRGDIRVELEQSSQNGRGSLKTGGLEKTPSLLITNPVWTIPICNCSFLFTRQKFLSQLAWAFLMDFRDVETCLAARETKKVNGNLLWFSNSGIKYSHDPNFTMLSCYLIVILIIQITYYSFNNEKFNYVI